MNFSLDRVTLHRAYRDGLDPAAVVADCLAAAERHPGVFIALAPAPARQALDALGPFDPHAKPLWGLPFAIKDNIDLAGAPTTAACPAFAYDPARSATAVARLIAAGAIPIGKTNLDQFATGLVGVRTPYPVPLNSFDPAIVPGGSSSGSAVAVARGLASFALGTDTAGSGRVPAGLNNLVGLKPTLGAVPTAGVVPACRTLDCISVFGLTVEDAWAVYTAMAGYDHGDPWSKAVLVGTPGAIPPGLRAGVPDRASRRFFGDAAAERAADRALAAYEAVGITPVEIDFAPLFAVADLLYEGAWVAERYAGIRSFLTGHRDALHPITARIILGAERLSAADAFAGIYRLAELRRAVEPIWSGLDLLAVPTLPRAYTVAELDADPIGPNSALGTYTNFVNLLDLCALAVPGRFREDGLPAGTTLIASAGQDAMLATIGMALQPRGRRDARRDRPSAARSRRACTRHGDGRGRDRDRRHRSPPLRHGPEPRPRRPRGPLPPDGAHGTGLSALRPAGRAAGPTGARQGRRRRRRLHRGRGLGSTASRLRALRRLGSGAAVDRHVAARRRDDAQGFSLRDGGARWCAGDHASRRLARVPGSQNSADMMTDRWTGSVDRPHASGVSQHPYCGNALRLYCCQKARSLPSLAREFGPVP